METAGVVKLKNTHLPHFRLGRDRAHIHHAVPLILGFFQPRTGDALRICHAQVLGTQQLAGAAAGRRDIVANHKSEHDKSHTQNQKIAQSQLGSHPAGAQNREFRRLCKFSHDEDGANQDRDGQQLINMRRYQQQDIGHGVFKGITFTWPFAYPFELIGQIKEEKQTHETQGGKADFGQHLGVDHALNGFQAASRLKNTSFCSRCGKRVCSLRHHSPNKPSTSTGKCNAKSILTIPHCPEATALRLTLIRL